MVTRFRLGQVKLLHQPACLIPLTLYPLFSSTRIGKRIWVSIYLEPVWVISGAKDRYVALKLHSQAGTSGSGRGHILLGRLGFGMDRIGDSSFHIRFRFVWSAWSGIPSHCGILVDTTRYRKASSPTCLTCSSVKAKYKLCVLIRKVGCKYVDIILQKKWIN